MRRSLFVVVIALMVAGVAFALMVQQPRFPHEKHARLFPLCIGCHEGIPEGDRVRSFPTPQLCAGCHNGKDQPTVVWAARTERTTNLKFSHAQHPDVRDGKLDCSECHTRAGTERMAVVHTVPDRCFACHAHEARNHYVDARCSQCHVPLARTAFTASRVQSLPEPPSHKEPQFLEGLHGRLARTQREQCQVCHTRERCAACHVDANTRTEIQAMPAAEGRLQLPVMTARAVTPASHKSPQFIEKHGAAAKNAANCATCHTRESCATCHVDANKRAEIQKLPAAEPGRQPVATAAHYFIPASHKSADWMRKHGGAAQNTPTCATCHTRESCQTCHSGIAPKVVSALPSRATTVAQGVVTARKMPESHKAPFFDRRHGATATTRDKSCMTCHVRTQCEQCHNSAGTGQPMALKAARASYHPDNFMQRHASAAYNRNLECANCHETTRFCRACHEQVGMGTTGRRLQAGFHDAQSSWLLNHGKPARQGLESCASCHKQTDCMQCHSQLGSFRISPHGPGFDARKLQSKNARMCFACHLTNPISGNEQ